jgi:oxygen-independent coproporphyrinogen-3 oxidase
MCNYCGCHVIISRDRSRADRYLTALALEAKLVARHLGEKRVVSRLHLGGGTPTFLDEGQLMDLWLALSPFTMAPDADLSLEINPTVTRPSQLELLASLGWRRLSIGVQDFDPEVQRAIDRVQTVAETRLAVETARSLGFRSINLDLIYGLPGQRPETFRRTLQQVAELGPDRIACFSFAYVPSLKPHQKRLPVAGLPSAAQKLELAEVARAELTRAGYVAVGMDHFARPDDELARAAARGALGRDFQGYTVERPPRTIGLGVSSISDFGDAYAQNVKSLGDYYTALDAGRLPTERGIRLDHDDLARRAVIEQLMCNFTVDLGDCYHDERSRLAPLVAYGLVEIAGNRVIVKPEGRRFVRNVAMVFDAHLDAGQQRFSRAV